MSRVDETGWRQREFFFTTSDGVRIVFSDNGNQIPRHLPSTGPDTTVLFLHGWTQNREAWDDVAGPLHEMNPQLRIVALDHRGHGQSDPAPAGTVNTARLACDVAEFITAQIPAGRIVIVGHSMGGMTMMALGAIRPELVAQRISAAVFVNTSATEPLKALRILGPFSRMLKSLFTAAIGHSWVIRRGFLMRLLISTIVFGRNPRPYDVSRVWDQIRSGDPRTYQEAARAMMTNNVRDGLQPYEHKPAAVLAGARDLLTAAADSREIATLLHTNELHIYPGAGHMLPNERATELINEITNVLATLEDTEGLNKTAS